MLYILPPLRTQNPSSWSNFCAGNGDASANIESTAAWNDGKRPPRVTLRNLQIVNKIDDGSAGFDEMDTNRNPKSLSECYFAGKGTALVLPDADAHSKTAGGGLASGSRFGATSAAAQGGSNIQKHLQSMFYLLRPEETLKMAVKLESAHTGRTRYLVVVSMMGVRGEECCLLGIDCNEKTTVGLVLRVLANTQITLDGDGGFSVSVCDRHHIFKPVSVQAMWSALQTLHKVSAKAREQNYFQGGGTHSWVEYYERRIESDRSCINEWHAMDDLESKRPPSPDSIRHKPTEIKGTEKIIRSTLKDIMMSVDLDEVTSKAIRTKLEEELDMDLTEYKSFIDEEMLVILGQMDAPTEIFEHVYLGSEWNASNYEELQKNGVGHILNVTREIDNFFPGTFDYLNIRVYDDEKTDLLKHWDDTYKYITKAKDNGSKVLVHCKMGISRSASVVIAYAMKACNWDFNTALKHVKEKRNCIKPNTSFLSQLETYQGILDAMKNKEKLQRSKSETNLKSPETSGGKLEKVLANSEPTPIVQALSKSMVNETGLSGSELRHFGARPKSWSPDNLTTRELAKANKSSPLFLSLEDISQKSTTTTKSVSELKTPLPRHVLMPCDNGESYSVSPNQIVHLPGHDVTCDKKKIVLDLAMRFTDSSERRKTEETWDPGEQGRRSNEANSSNVCDSIGQGQCLCGGETDSAVPSSCSSDKVPDTRKDSDHLEPPSNIAVISATTTTTIELSKRESPSRQSSWSSYDSAVAFNESCGELSRHSSWGSGDTRAALPSRNSSWGSYDIKRAKEEIPWHRGTVQRSKRKIEQRSDGDSETLLFECGKEASVSTSAISDCIDIPGEAAGKSASCSRLSISAPEPSSMELVHDKAVLSRSTLTMHQSSVLARKSDEVCDGKVRNLKKEFEAKSAVDLLEPPAKATSSSVPASPVSVHKSETSNEDATFKSLIGMFETCNNNNKEGEVVVQRRHARPFAPSRNGARFSCIEVGDKGRILQTPLISNLHRNGASGGGDRRPPIVPVVRNAGASPGLMVAASVITAAAKKKQQQQQYGKSHPLAKLIKPRHNNPVYNTM